MTQTTEPAAVATDEAAGSPSDALRARLSLVALCFGWGVTWPIMKIALNEIPPFSMRIGSIGLGITTLTILMLLQGRSFRIPTPMTWLHIVVAAIFNIVGFSIFTPFAQLSADTSRVAIIVYTMPIWATLLARVALGERLTAASRLGLVLCIAGMAVLIYPLSQLGIPVGILLALGAAMSWAAGTVYFKWAQPQGDPVAISAYQLIVAFGIVACALPMVEGSLHLAQASTTAMLALLFSGVVGSGISYVLWFDIVRRLPAATASLGILSSPVIGVLSAMLILGERPTAADITGFAMIFAASACVVLLPHKTQA
jgi:drug/metabolite transporter (DMT)-like permease